jgi:hypothetical protein
MSACRTREFLMCCYLSWRDIAGWRLATFSTRLHVHLGKCALCVSYESLWVVRWRLLSLQSCI